MNPPNILVHLQLLWLHTGYQFKVFLHVPPFCRNSNVNLSPQCSRRSFIAAAILAVQLPVSRHGVSVVFVEVLDTISGCNVCKLRSWHSGLKTAFLEFRPSTKLWAQAKRCASQREICAAVCMSKIWCIFVRRVDGTKIPTSRAVIVIVRTRVGQVGWWADLRRNALGAS